MRKSDSSFIDWADDKRIDGRGKIRDMSFLLDIVVCVWDCGVIFFFNLDLIFFYGEGGVLGRVEKVLI